MDQPRNSTRPALSLVPRVFDPTGKLRFENLFVEDLALWDQPCINATAHAVEALQLVDPTYVPHPQTINFVWECYDHEKAEFVFSPGKRGASRVCCMRMALSVFRALQKKKCEEKLDYDFLEDTIRRRHGPGEVERMRHQILERLKKILRQETAEETVVDVHLALWILWQLSPKTKYVPEEDVRRLVYDYLKGCFSESDPPGFTLHPGSKDRCLTSIRSVYQVALRCRLLEELGPFLSQSAEYVRLCWSSHVGGFSMMPGDPPNIAHTFLGLVLCEKFKYEGWPIPVPEAERSARVRDFVESCRRNGGYGFGTEGAANVYACRLYAQILIHLPGDKTIPPERVIGLKSFIEKLQTTPGGFKGLSELIELIDPPRKWVSPEDYRLKVREWSQRLKEERAFYMSHKAEILGQFEGKCVAIFDKKVVDHDSDKFELVRRIRGEYPGQAVLVTEVTKYETVEDLPSPEEV